MNQAAESELASIGARAVAVARSELEAAKEDMQLSELEEFLLRCKAKDFLKDFMVYREGNDHSPQLVESMFCDSMAPQIWSEILKNIQI